MADLTELETEVAENTTVVGSAIALINGFKDRLAAAGVDPAKLAALRDALDINSNALAAAVEANTPAEARADAPADEA